MDEIKKIKQSIEHFEEGMTTEEETFLNILLLANDGLLAKRSATEEQGADTLREGTGAANAGS